MSVILRTSLSDSRQIQTGGCVYRGLDRPMIRYPY
uniref:Uncharacterized protein n=1 Tax=Talaromyces marneffei PM1 TaxID=1077442 RepID=A0A093XE99_TALMA